MDAPGFDLYFGGDATNRAIVFPRGINQTGYRVTAQIFLVLQNGGEFGHWEIITLLVQDGKGRMELR